MNDNILMCVDCWAEDRSDTNDPDPGIKTIKIRDPKTGERVRLCGGCMLNRGIAVSMAQVRRYIANG